MLRCLPGHPGHIQETLCDRLWVCASPLLRLGDQRALVAAEGFVAGDGLREALVATAQTPSYVSAPQGHYALLCADLQAGSLALLRSLSGGEHLYYARVGQLVLFAASVRPLLAHPQMSRRLNRAVIDEVLLTGLTTFGHETLHRGVDEVLPGHVVILSDRIGKQRWHSREALRSPSGSPAALAAEFREALCSAVAMSVGRQRPVAIALSGGIDSSAVAAAAVEVVGADAIEAFTYEFDDPTHDTETHFAAAVCQRLGIRRHHVFRISFDAFLAAIPEMVWRSESFVHWPKAFMLPIARHIGARGHSQYLTGFGIGSHMSYLRELAGVLHWLPAPQKSLSYWRSARFDCWNWSRHLVRLHPGLEPPHPRLYLLLVRLLHHAGVITDVAAFFPPAMQPLLEQRRDINALEPELAQASLLERLQLVAFSHLISCIDVTRSEKASREVGVCRVSPAHFAGCIPYAYFPIEPPPRLWSPGRRLRPGKYLLRHAYRNVLPESVLFRQKSWLDAVASPHWLRSGRLAMLRALPEFPSAFRRFGPGYHAAVQCWEPHSILATGLAFRLWERIFVEDEVSANPPTWAALLAGSSFRARGQDATVDPSS